MERHCSGEVRRILIMDDDCEITSSLSDILLAHGYQATVTSGVELTERTIAKFEAQVALVDILLGNRCSINLVDFLKNASPQILCVLLTANDMVDNAIAALQHGAFDYLRKPVNAQELLATIMRCFEEIELEQERSNALGGMQRAHSQPEQLKKRLKAVKYYLQEGTSKPHGFDGIVGNSPLLKAVLRQIEQVAPTDSTVLIQGETGTGKELIARAIHTASHRQDRPLVKVNCATLPATLIESALFGHEKGAFTGAFSRQEGRFVLADGGTIFLDEIGELPIELQAKLLRVLQEGELERLGNATTIKVDIRVIAATNRDLKAAVHKGQFRSDLYYRLNIFPIVMPPLRERPEDIPLLVRSFVNEFALKMKKPIKRVPLRSMARLQKYPWPGNVRELRNVIERAMIITRNSTLQAEVPEPARLPASASLIFEEMQRDHLCQILHMTNWRVEGNGGAANMLGLNPNTLRSKMRKLGIRKPLAG